MVRKRRGKSDRELIRKALERARAESEAPAEAEEAFRVAAIHSGGRGACFLTVRGRTGCDVGITEDACNAAAARLGGLAVWVENGSCD